MIAGVVAISIAFLLIGISLLAKKRAKAQFAWIQLPATVLSATVGMGRVFIPSVEYEYMHEGRRFRGVQLRTLMVGWGWSGPARRTVEKYKVGAAINVFVDPRDPANAVIEPGGDRNFLPFCFSMAVLALYVGVRFICAAA